MLLVDCLEVRPSRVHGLGLFATAPIKAGTMLFRWTPGYDLLWTEEEFGALPASAQRTIERFGWRVDGRGWYAAFDESRYTNHSSTFPTSRWWPEEQAMVAARDIAPGEEILEDYSEFDDDFYSYVHLLLY